VLTTQSDAPVVAAAADVAPAEWTLEHAMAEGETLYNANCAACHQPNGQGMPPAFPPIAGSAVATGDVAAHIDVAVHGKPGTAMAAFGPQLSDDALAAIVTYQRNAFGNDTGDLVTPDQIAAVR
jgi:cytochrome c oxidase subunit 2